MRFIIDGDGTVSKSAVRVLLRDVIKPYPKPLMITPMFTNSGEGSMNLVNDTLEIMANASLCTHSRSVGIFEEVAAPGDKIFIVLGADTRKHAVTYCLANSIQVLDLERGLYPVDSVE